MSDADASTDPWADDLFNRRTEADLLIGYIESICERQTMRDDIRAHTIAVNAGYGEGKTFFLKRLAIQLAEKHPVAFVDAWADDLADEPLTAIAATLQEALNPLIQKSETVRQKWDDVLQRTGKVAKIVAVGLAKRGLSLAIGTAAVEATEAVVTGLSDAGEDAVMDGLKEAGNRSVEGAIASLTSVAPHKIMKERIQAFEEGQDAITQMKQSLRALVAALSAEDVKAPIIVVIDELDRCRPTYAIKLLEEVKHLFDVPGLVFLFGIHTGQLAHSVSNAYGTGFDGRAYLRRFLTREYSLATPDLEPLVSRLMASANISRQLAFDPLRGRDVPFGGTPPHFVVAKLMRYYGLAARDAFEVVDILQTAAALAEGQRLHLPYLLPLIIGYMKGLPPGSLPDPVEEPDWHYIVSSRSGSSATEVGPHKLAMQYQAATRMSDEDLGTAHSEYGEVSRPQWVVAQDRENYGHRQPIWAVANYPLLVRTVGRFANPQIVEAVGTA